MSPDYELFLKLRTAQKANNKQAADKYITEISQKWEKLENKMYNLYKDRATKLGITPSFDDYKSDAAEAMLKAIKNVDLNKVPDPDKWNFYFPLWGYIKREITTSLTNTFKNSIKNTVFSLDDPIFSEDDNSSKANIVASVSDPAQDLEKAEFQSALDEAIRNSMNVFSNTQKKIYAFITSEKVPSRTKQMNELSLSYKDYQANLLAVRNTVKVELSRACNKRHIPMMYDLN